jgi:hypothetical protein
VWGEATFNGVVGRASGNAGKGIDGFSGGAAGVGVAGECATAIGVRGRGRVGVMGESLTTQGSGVRGEGAIGIVGATKGTNSTAMFADATKGGEALLAFSPDGTAVSATSNGVAGFFYGNVIVVGNLQVTGGLAVTGTKSATVECSDGRQRALYAIEAPESWFEDVGEAQLRSGRAEVPLARDFAGVIRTARYQVFLTPYGEVRGLFVARRTRHGFTVAELGGGSSSARFAYRIVARRRDVSASRMPVVSSKAPSRPDLREHLQRLRRMSSASGSKKRRDAKKQGASRRPPLAGTPASPTRGAGLSPRRRAVAGAQ